MTSKDISLKVGQVVTHTYRNGHVVKCEVLDPSGICKVNGVMFKSLSAAARAANTGEGKFGLTTDGYMFFGLKAGQADLASLIGKVEAAIVVAKASDGVDEAKLANDVAAACDRLLALITA